MRRKLGYCITVTCLAALVLLLLIGLVFAFLSPRTPVVKPTPVEKIALNGACEFSAQDGGACKLWVSRKQDKIRIEPLQPGPKTPTCIGSLSKPNGDWLVFLPDQKTYFKWSQERVERLKKTRPLLSSRLFNAALTEYSGPGSSRNLTGLKDMVAFYTSWSPSRSGKALETVQQGKYKLVGSEQVDERRNPHERFRLIRSVYTTRYSPELGIKFSSTASLDGSTHVHLALSDVQESPIDPSLFQAPAGYKELFSESDPPESTPKALLETILPPGFRSMSVFPQPTVQDLRWKGGAGIETTEAASSGSTGREGYVQLWLRQAVFEDAKDGLAYAEYLRSERPSRGHILRSDNPEDFRKWEAVPTAGERCFWKDRLHLVFVRGQSVVSLTATTYSQQELQQRFDLLRSLAPVVDQRLSQQ